MFNPFKVLLDTAKWMARPVVLSNSFPEVAGHRIRIAESRNTSGLEKERERVFTRSLKLAMFVFENINNAEPLKRKCRFPTILFLYYFRLEDWRRFTHFDLRIFFSTWARFPIHPTNLRGNGFTRLIEKIRDTTGDAPKKC